MLTQAKLALAGRFRNDAVAVTVLFALIIASWFHRVSSPVDLRFDGAVYYILGTSLAEGKGYRLLNEPGEIQAVQYPPLLPLTVAAHQWMLGMSDPMTVGRWLKLWLFFIFVLYVFASYWMLRTYLPLKYAFPATLIACLASTRILCPTCLPRRFRLHSPLFFSVYVTERIASRYTRSSRPFLLLPHMRCEPLGLRCLSPGSQKACSTEI